MKKITFIIVACLAFKLNFSQNTFTINNETLELKTEIDGKLDLLWNTFNNNYRYFVRTEDGTITELSNTKDKNNTYKEEYKTLLNNLTGKTTNKLKLTLYDLIKFIDSYNASADTNYTTTTTLTKHNVQLRLGFSGGVTNNPFVGNPDNKIHPLIGAELELYEAYRLPRHSGFLQVRHAFDSNDFPYSTTELSLGYRYRIINAETFSIYGQVKLATLNFSDVTFTNENDMEVTNNDTSFDIPFIFGIGSDIKMGENSFITIIYGELFAAFLDNQGNFSTDIAIGYKFKL